VQWVTEGYKLSSRNDEMVPIPEIVAALVISAIAFGIRVAWTIARTGSGRRGETASHQAAADRGADRARARLVASCVLLVIISVPLILRLVPPNGVYGFRTGATMSTPEIWYPANAFMGWSLSIAGVVSATLLVMLPTTAKRSMLWTVFLVPVAGAVVLSFAYLSHL
jgi:hypothetical protein